MQIPEKIIFTPNYPAAAEITTLRLAGIAFDSKTLRVIAEAGGAINVAVTALPGL